MALRDQTGGRESKNESERQALMKELLEDIQKENQALRKKLQKHTQILSTLEDLMDSGTVQALEKRCERLNRRREELEKKLTEMEERGKALLLDQFAAVQEDLRELKDCEPYGELFKKIAEPLQILIGLGEAVDTLTDEKRDYYMWDRVAQPLVRAVEDSHGTCEGFELTLPLPQMELYDKTIEDKIEKAKAMDCEALKQWIEEEISRKAQGKILRQERKLIRDLTDEVIRPIEEVWKAKAEGKFDWEQNRNKELPQRLAIAARNILKCNEVWPVSASDQKLEKYPEPGKFFMPLKENAVRYPALLIKYGEKWEVLGERLGMDTWEEKAFPNRETNQTDR